MAQNKIQLPQSGGGLVRYFEDIKSRFEFGPWTVVAIIIVIIALVLLLHALNPFGF
ncbi:MAG: preprotein translocase subunit Sec61beta [Nanoarchaeota archaeon]